MSRANAQSQRSSTPSLPSPLPYSTKDEAKRWLEQILTQQQGIPPSLTEKASTLQKKINIKGQPWDELKPDLEALYLECVQLAGQQSLQLEHQRQQSLQQVLQVQVPNPFLRDARVDALIQKVNELEITKQVKVEVTADIEHIKTRLKSDIDDNFEKVKQLRTDLAERDERIAELREKLKKLVKEKKELQNKIETLESQIEELKQSVENLQMVVAEKDKKIETLMSMHDKRMETMSSRIEELETKNKELEKMNESRIVVGETMKLMIKAIYKHVHPKLKHRKKNSYSVQEIGNHLTTKYILDLGEKKAAEERWKKLKDELNWDEDTEDTIQELIDKRNQTAHPLKPPIDKIEFRDALRQMKEEEDIEDSDERTAYCLFMQCQRKFNI